MSIPESWTDDMSVPLPPGMTAKDLADRVLEAAITGTELDRIEEDLRTSLGLSTEEAALARDRTFGGVFRAGTTATGNKPDPRKDPIAAASYQRARESPEIIEALFPGRFRRTATGRRAPAASNKPWWRFW